RLNRGLLRLVLLLDEEPLRVLLDGREVDPLRQAVGDAFGGVGPWAVADSCDHDDGNAVHAGILPDEGRSCQSLRGSYAAAASSSSAGKRVRIQAASSGSRR